MIQGISRRRVLAFGASAAAGALAGIPGFRSYAETLPSRDVTQRPFGAAGDGERDDTAAIQRAIDDAAQRGGGTVVLPPGRYLVSRPLTIDSSQIQIIGTPGRTVLTKKTPTRYIDVGGRHRLKGSAASFVAEKAGIGSLTIRVRGAAGQSTYADQWAVVLAGTRAPDRDAIGQADADVDYRYAAQFIHIRSSRDGVLELSTPLRMECRPDTGDKVVPVDWIRGCRISGIGFDGAGRLTGRNLQESNVLTLQWCLEPVVRTIEAWDLPNLFVALEGCLRADVSEVTCRNTLSTGIEGPERGFGYVVVERGLNEGALISHLRTDRVRHSYTTANASSRIGVPFGSRIAHSVAMAARGAGFDTHPIGENIAFINCAVIGSLHVGFQVRSAFTQLIGCSAQDCQGAALQIHLTATDTQVSGFVSRRTGFGRFRKIDWSKRGAIHDRGKRTTIQGAQVADCAGPGVHLDDGGDDATYRSIRVNNPCLAGHSPTAGFRVGGASITQFLVESCLVSSDARRLDTGFEIDAPNLVEGMVRGCRARNAAQTVKTSSAAVRIGD